MFRLGLTGSIGMGKSTTAGMFAEVGCSVWDADAAVHRLYSEGGAAVAPIEKAFPDAVLDGKVSRDMLKHIIQRDSAALARIEAIVHPLVRQDRDRFAQDVTSDIAVFDIPLLFETGAEDEFDAVTTVYVPEQTQRRRVLDRGTMTEEQLDLILQKQMSADEKAERADFVIETDTMDHARQQVQSIVTKIRKGWPDA